MRAELARGRPWPICSRSWTAPHSEFAQAVVRASLVGETYFFRHPEHFRFISREGLPRVMRSGVTHLRGWSAGCATGEEAYSLAACLLSAALPGITVDVVGTDINEGSLTTARRATYGAWSRRESGPHLFPLYRPLEERQVASSKGAQGHHLRGGQPDAAPGGDARPVPLRPLPQRAHLLHPGGARAGDRQHLSLRSLRGATCSWARWRWIVLQRGWCAWALPSCRPSIAR